MQYSSIVMHPLSLCVVYMQISEALSKLQRKTFLMVVAVLVCVFAIRFVLQSAKAQLYCSPLMLNATPPKSLFIGFCSRFNETTRRLVRILQPASIYLPVLDCLLLISDLTPLRMKVSSENAINSPLLYCTHQTLIETFYCRSSTRSKNLLKGGTIAYTKC